MTVGGTEVPVETTFEIARYLQVLHDRFRHITDLRTMTARRHVTLCSLAGGLLITILQFEQKAAGLDLETIGMVAGGTLSVMGMLVTVYDAMMNHRAGAVASEMARCLQQHEILRTGIRGCPRGSAAEDFLYFSQILVVNAVVLTVTVGLLLGGGLERSVMAFILSVGLYSAAWFGTRTLYTRVVGDSTWLPTARSGILVTPASNPATAAASTSAAAE